MLPLTQCLRGHKNSSGGRKHRTPLPGRWQAREPKVICTKRLVTEFKKNMCIMYIYSMSYRCLAELWYHYKKNRKIFKVPNTIGKQESKEIRELGLFWGMWQSRSLNICFSEPSRWVRRQHLCHTLGLRLLEGPHV